MATAQRALEYTRPWLYPKQHDAIFCHERYAVTEATVKAGKTIGCLIWLTEQAMAGRVGQNYWWVAPILAQAKIAFRRLKRGLPQELYTANESELTITLINGAVLWFKGSDHPDTLYGEDVYAAVIDEATRCKEDCWAAVRSTLTATRGPIRIIGNVRGRKNWAYQLARRAESGDPGMHYAKLTAYDAIEAGILAPDEIADAKSKLPDAVFRELYLAEPSDDEGNPFGIAAIRACIAPLSNKPPAWWGVDLAKSVDWTVAIALDTTGAACRFGRWQSPWQETLSRLQRLLGGTRALVDSTGVGDPIVEQLSRTAGNIEGFKFTMQSKQQIMEGLAVAIQNQEISYPEGPIVQELETFEYVYSRTGVHYAAPEGLYDDCVCALALARQHSRSWRQVSARGAVGGERAVIAPWQRTDRPPPPLMPPTYRVRK